jgi:hypothetical protein
MPENLVASPWPLHPARRSTSLLVLGDGVADRGWRVGEVGDLGGGAASAVPQIQVR